MTPDGYIEAQAWMTATATRAVLAALTADGAVARFVGGCVRDAVLGRAVKDIDLATTDEPKTVIEKLERAGLKAVPTGIAHGTVTAVAEKQPFEITTLRRDVETDGRHATVAFTDDWIADAARRDFTFNAMFCDADGTLYDPFDGRVDLESGRVRFVGDAKKRIEEDVLRLLRFFRFTAWVGHPPHDVEAVAACREFAPKLVTLSGERVRNELLKLLAAPDPLPALALMDELDVTRHVIANPRDDRLRRLAAMIALEAETGDPIPRLAAIVADDVAALIERLRLSNAEAARLEALVAPDHTLGPDIDRQALRRVLYRIGPETANDLLLLAAADQGAGTWLESSLETVASWQSVKLPIKGRDVLARGIPAGQRVGELLTRVEQWWEDGDYQPDRDEALAYLDEIIAKNL
ncbi:MAG: CCA tRNA nucleotidyltransferase [Alphaproteobacteria bacterium]